LRKAEAVTSTGCGSPIFLNRFVHLLSFLAYPWDALME
jgi:hypothetical protein